MQESSIATKSADRDAVADDLAIVILNYNTAALLRDCLHSIAAGDHALRLSVTVVDNASSDGSAEMVRAEFPSVTLIANRTNVGYSAGNNVAMRAFGFDRFPPETARAAAALRAAAQSGHAGAAHGARRDGALHGRASADRRGGAARAAPGRQPRPRVPPQLPDAGGQLLPHDRAEPPLCRAAGASTRTTWSTCPRTPSTRSIRSSAPTCRCGARRSSMPGCSTSASLCTARTWTGQSASRTPAGKSGTMGPWKLPTSRKRPAARAAKSRIDFYEAMWLFYQKHYRSETELAARQERSWRGIVGKGSLDVARHLWRYCSGGRRPARALPAGQVKSDTVYKSDTV